MIARNKIDPLSFLLHSESPVHALETQIEKKKQTNVKCSLREICPNTELFLVRIFLFRTEYRKIRTRNNSVFGHFSRSDWHPSSIYV